MYGAEKPITTEIDSPFRWPKLETLSEDRCDYQPPRVASRSTLDLTFSMLYLSGPCHSRSAWESIRGALVPTRPRLSKNKSSRYSDNGYVGRSRNRWFRVCFGVDLRVRPISVVCCTNYCLSRIPRVCLLCDHSLASTGHRTRTRRLVQSHQCGGRWEGNGLLQRPKSHHKRVGGSGDRG